MLALALPVAAQASSGEISRFVVDSDWTKGSIAASITWTECAWVIPPKGPERPELPYPDDPDPMPTIEPSWASCYWVPYATVGPDWDPTKCSSRQRQLSTLGAGVRLIWSEDKRVSPGSAAFDLSGIDLDGSREQLLCLSVSKIAPYGGESTHYTLASALLAEPEASAPAQIGLPAPATEESQPRPRRPKRCAKRKRAGERKASQRGSKRCGRPLHRN
jgi:hypothetical protein